MSSAPKLYVYEPVSLDDDTLRPATPAEIAAYLREHHPDVLLRAAADEAVSQSERLFCSTGLYDVDEAASVLREVANRLEAERPRG